MNKTKRKKGGDDKCNNMEKEDLAKLSDRELASVHRKCCNNPFKQAMRSAKCKNLNWEMRKRWKYSNGDDDEDDDHDNSAVEETLDFYEDENKLIKSCIPLESDESFKYYTKDFDLHNLEKLSDKCCGPFTRKLKNKEKICSRLDAKIFRASQYEFEENLNKTKTFISENRDKTADATPAKELKDKTGSLKDSISMLEDKIKSTDNENVFINELRKINSNIEKLQTLSNVKISNNQKSELNDLIQKTSRPIADQIKQVANASEQDEVNKFGKYDKMRKMLPEGAVRQKMMSDGIPEKDIEAYFNSSLTTNAAEEASAKEASAEEASAEENVQKIPYVSKRKNATPKPTTAEYVPKKLREDPSDEELDNYVDMFDKMRNSFFEEGKKLGQRYDTIDKFDKVREEVLKTFTQKTYTEIILPYVDEHREKTVQEETEYYQAQQKKKIAANREAGQKMREILARRFVEGGKKSQRKLKKKIRKTNRRKI